MPSYDSINDLIRDHNLDRNHWINRESFRFVRKQIFDKTEVRIKHVPEELIDYVLTCPKGHKFSPDWLKKRHPISTFFCRDGSLLRQCACYVECPTCSSQVKFDIPQAKYNGDLDIFGDEAKRQVDGKTVFIYSFVSFSGDTKSESTFISEYGELKRELAPSIEPSDWVLHMKELTSKEKWRKKTYLKHLQSSDIHSVIIKMIDLIGRYNNQKKINLYSSSGIVIGDALNEKETQECQSEIYNSALMRVVRETTVHNLAPKFYFERTGKDGWAKNLFDGGRLTLLWAFITNGLPVMTPKFVNPSTSLYLEVADILSYLVARYLYCVGRRAEGGDISPEYDFSRLGMLRYIVTNGNGNWFTANSETYPSDLMFKGTSWEEYA